jgi:hypothetical protein
MIKGTLSLSQFTTSAATQGVWSTVASYTVPLGVFYRIQANTPISLRLTAWQSFTYSTAQTSGNVTVTVAGNVAVIPSYYNQPNYELSAIGFWYNHTTTKIVYASNITGNQITFPVNDTTSTDVVFTVYYLLNVGQYQWNLGVPLATGGYNAILHSSAIANVNMKDQLSTGSLVTFARDVTLPENFSLSLSTLSTPAVTMTNENMTPSAASTTPNVLAVLEIPCFKGDISELKKTDPNYIQNIVSSLTLYA